MSFYTQGMTQSLSSSILENTDNVFLNLFSLFTILGFPDWYHGSHKTACFKLDVWLIIINFFSWKYRKIHCRLTSLLTSWQKHATIEKRSKYYSIMSSELVLFSSLLYFVQNCCVSSVIWFSFYCYIYCILDWDLLVFSRHFINE